MKKKVIYLIIVILLIQTSMAFDFRNSKQSKMDITLSGEIDILIGGGTQNAGVEVKSYVNSTYKLRLDSDKSLTMGDNTTQLEKIGAIIGGAGSANKTLKVQNKIASISKQSLAVQKQILEKTEEAALTNV